MKAYLYDGMGQVVAVRAVPDGHPPDHLYHQGVCFKSAGSSARLSDTGVEQIGWDYVIDQAEPHDGTRDA